MMPQAGRMSFRLFLIGCVVGLSGFFAPGAGASQLIDRNASQIHLAVNDSGIAMITYKARGKVHHVLARGAIDARPPTVGTKQVAFKLDYAGGWGFFRKMKYWKKFRNTCTTYTGPALAWYVTGCQASDGSYWALQKWQRMLPNYGVKATKPSQTAWELRLSHWDTDLPVLDVYLDWAYHEHYDHLFGVLTYVGNPVYGFGNTPFGAPTDSWGRNIYVDTFNSAYGPGWRRENSFLTHNPTGGFCYGFYTHTVHGKTRPVGDGAKYRATVVGPGVTPDVSWRGTPVPYSEDLETQALAKRAEVLGNDPQCTTY